MTSRRNEVTRVVDGELQRMVRQPESLTADERRGVRSFEHLLTKIGQARDDDEDGNVPREKANRLVRKAIEDIPRPILRGFAYALAEYIALVSEETLPEPGQVIQYIENGEWFRVEIDEPKKKDVTARPDPQFQLFLERAVGGWLPPPRPNPTQQP